MRTLPLSFGFAVATAAASVAGTFSQNFDAYAAATGSTTYADNSKLETNAPWSGVQAVVGSATNKALRLTQQPFGGTNAVYRVPNLDSGKEVAEFTVDFKMELYRGVSTMGDGLGLCFGAVPASGTGNGELGFTMAGGLVISFDTYNSGGAEGPAIEVICNGNQVAQVLTTFTSDTNYRRVLAHWDANGLDLSYDANNDGDFGDAGEVVFTNLNTPGFAPSVDNTFAFTAKTSTGVEDAWIDDISIATSQAVPAETGGPVLSEFMADNSETLEDEDVETPDWIEIYNGQSTAANMAGYKLLHGAAVWTFPSVTAPAYGYLTLFASGKNRTSNPAMLHTNFTLEKSGGVITLQTPASVTVSSITYPPQKQDVSYGVRFQGNLIGFIDRPSPGTATTASDRVAPNGPAEDVSWSRDGGIISGTTAVGINPPAAGDAVVRYTTDNTVPTEGSAPYVSAFSLSSSTNLRARVFRPGWLPGDVSSRVFLRVDSTLTNYNGTGQIFSSNIPVLVFDSFGVNVDAANGASRPPRYTGAVVIGVDSGTGRAALDAVPDFVGRTATHVHGESSAGFAQRSYNWEFWDNKDQDKDAGVLGMPAGSDWILHGSFSDKSAMRNHLTFSMMREMRPDWAAPRSRQVEVFFNQQVGEPVSFSDYKGVYTLLEKIKRSKNRVDIAKLNDKAIDPLLTSGGYIFKKDKADAGATSWTTSAPFSVGLQSHDPATLNAAQLTALTTYINNFQAVLNGGTFADLTNGYAAWIDVSSFIDQQLAVELTKQIDGYVFSTYWYKDRAGKIHAGPAWDFNIALGNANYGQGDRSDGWNYDAVGANSGGVGSNWYPRLHQDPWYRLRTFDRYWEWRRTILTNAAFTSRVNAEAAKLADGGNLSAITATSSTTIQSPAARHFRKWAPPSLSPALLGGDYWPNPPGFATRTTYQLEIDYLNNWMTTRLNWLDNQFLSGTVILRPPDFSIAGGDVPPGASLTISPYTGTPPSGYSYAALGTLFYTTDGSDPYLSTVGTGVETTHIAGGGAACKWLVPTAGNGGTSLTAGAGAQQWTTYTDPPNIANWSSAVTGVGYERNTADATNYVSLIGSGGNTESQMYGINATCYIRIPFSLANQAALDNIGTLKLAIKYDDGFRAYLNGTVVAGRNDTDASMTNSPATAVANQIHDDAAAVVYEDIDITATGKSALRIGTNVLAIHGLNSPSTSSDLIFVPKLTSFPPTNPGAGAQTYTGPLTLNATTTVKARLRTAAGAWTPLTEATYTINTIPATASNLVISEIMYNPSNPTTAEINAGFLQANNFEYLELMNIHPTSMVDLTGVKFTEGINFNFDDGDPTAIALPPGGRVLVVANSAAFAVRHGVPVGAKVAGIWQGNLANGGEQLKLLDQAGNTIRDFVYDNNEPWPSAADGVGYSLTLNNPLTNPNHALAESWRASAQPGGTPGAAAGPAFSGNPTGDTDGDGYPDFLEYALGSNLNSYASTAPPVATVQPMAIGPNLEDYLVFSYRRNNAADGVHYFPELSTDLNTWDTAGLVYLGTSQNGDGAATVTYRASVPFRDGQRQYVRLRVTP